MFPMEPAPAPAVLAVDRATAVAKFRRPVHRGWRVDLTGHWIEQPRHAVLGAAGQRDAVLGLALGLGGGRQIDRAAEVFEAVVTGQLVIPEQLPAFRL